MSAPVLGRQVERTRAVAVLAVGDVLAIAAFVLAGVASHGYHPVGDADRVLYVLWPFLLAWAVVAVGGRLYTGRAIGSVRRTLVQTALAWALTVGIALAIRSLPWYVGGAAPTFALVALAVGGSLLVGWRLAATLLLGER